MNFDPGIKTNLRTKGLSVSQVEDWKIPIPSYDLFPTVPLTFDEVYWDAYWPIVTKPAPFVREVLMKLEKETKEKEKMVGNKQKLEKDETQEKKQKNSNTREEESWNHLLNHHCRPHQTILLRKWRLDTFNHQFPTYLIYLPLLE